MTPTRFYALCLGSGLMTLLTHIGQANANTNKPTLSAGFWGNYQYLPDDEANKNSWGEIGNEALILYLDGAASEGEGRWFYSAELRAGPGGFTDPDNNSTGDQFGLKRAWVGWKLDNGHQVVVGKSQVPFGWKTVNFWPGDMLMGGFGDQMDVGVKASGRFNQLNYDAAFYLADDWGSDSTDTMDDNGHWGSSTTYRKVQTWVGNLGWAFNEQHQIGLSLQSGKLQDLMVNAGAVNPDRPVDGEHNAAVLYYTATFDHWYAKASMVQMQRDLPEDYRFSENLPGRIENDRYAVTVGYETGPWNFYLDSTAAEPGTEGNTGGTVSAFAPGFKYDYGPGWVYVEYLTQDGFIDRNGEVGEGDFEALYVTLDFYL